jgi:hypothetical protein
LVGDFNLMCSLLRRRVARLIVTLGAVTLVWACNAPFIPVPPPNNTTFTAQLVADGSGGQKTVWITSGGPYQPAAAAEFFIVDEPLGTGVVARANPDGSYQAPAMDGTRGDRVRIFYQTPQGAIGPEICRLLMDGPAAAPACP